MCYSVRTFQTPLHQKVTFLAGRKDNSFFYGKQFVKIILVFIILYLNLYQIIIILND